VIQYLEAESYGSSRSSALVQTNGFRVDEAKPCSAGARSGGRGGPDPTCRAVDAESAAAPFAPNAPVVRGSRRLAGGSDVTGEQTGMKK
jgi:hypothetical protein